MVFCRSCGQQLESDDRFCGSCGAPREAAATTPPRPYEEAEIRWTNTVLGLTSDYYVNREGAGQAASKATSNLNTGITVAGALLGSLTATGAGLIQKGREDDFIAWNDARSVTLNGKKKHITVTRKSLIFPVRLYCTDENYAEVVSFIRGNVDPALVSE